MDSVAREAYQQLLGTIDDVPSGIVQLHDQFCDYWKRLGRNCHSVPGEVMALIAVLGKGREPRQGDPVLVEGAPAKYISKWKQGTVRVKYPGDSKKFRVVPEESVKYD